jgi:polyhydroxyalkanoate synthesis repressor PhaR
MSNLRTIKKYSNRRLYDLKVKRYVTLDDVYEWVVDGADVRVIDQDSQEDVTCAVLLQLITALEKRLDPSLSLGFLQQAIRAGTHTSSGMTALFLDLGLKLFLSGDLQRLVGAAPSDDPTQAAEHLAAETYRRWCSARTEISRTLANATSSEPATEGQVARSTAPRVLDKPEGRLRRSPRQPPDVAARK